jgi:predicted RND superfamily exporter protein
MADIGTKKMQKIKDEIRPRIDSIFDPEKYDVVLTGNSIVFLKGTNFLVKNLFTSLALAIVVISILMSILFSSYRMVVVSLIPNFIPLLVTAGLMGYFGIAIKPSTILVFSIAFGISVDDTIHYLAKYRQELKLMKWNIKESVIAALRESGVSMIYTSIVLFFGFGIFSVSNFGGTVALGILVSITLFVAMLSNLVLLPCLLLSLEKSLTTKAFKEPMVQIIDEEEDIELDDLVVRKNNGAIVPDGIAE